MPDFFGWKSDWAWLGSGKPWDSLVTLSLANTSQGRLVWMHARLFEVNLAINILKIPFISLPVAASWAISHPSKA